jgi:hypothetical protein
MTATFDMKHPYKATPMAGAVAKLKPMATARFTTTMKTAPGDGSLTDSTQKSGCCGTMTSECEG